MADVKQQIPDEAVSSSGALKVTIDQTTHGTSDLVAADITKLGGVAVTTALPIQGYQPAATTFSGVIVTGALASTSVVGFNVATVTLRTFTGSAAPTVTFKLQASDDNTNWVDLQGINNSTGVVGVSFTQQAALAAGTGGPSVDFAIGAYTNVRINVTAITGTTPTAAFGLGLQSMPYEPSPGAIAQGTTATGAAITGAGNPVYTGGSDGTNVRPILTSTSGVLAAQVTGATGTAMLPAAAASADALANPTITQIGAASQLFNGTSWDRQRGMSVATTTGDSGAKTTTGNGATQTNVGNKGLQLVIVLGTVSGTTPTCVFKLQSSVDGGTTWVDIPGAATASLTATGNFGISVYPGQAVTAGTTTTNTTATANGVVARTWRVVWTIGGTTPSFAITSITYNYLPN